MAWWQLWSRRGEQKAVEASETAWAWLLGGGASRSGVTVSTDSALRVSAVLACARVIAEGCAQLPLKLYRDKEGGGKEIASDHAVHRLIWRRPNEWMTSFDLREGLTLHATLTGGGFALKNRVRGEVRELIPILPNMVTVRRADDGTVEYGVRDGKGAQTTLPRSEILHLRGPSWDGIVGLDMIKQAREAIGLAIATEESQSRFHANGARMGGIISTEQILTKEQVDQLREAWMAAQAGVANAYKTAILHAGMKFSPMTMTGLDAQQMETRRFQVEEVCRMMRVFPQMVMQADKTATYASAEQFFLAHVIHCLGPWVERWEQTISRDLLTDKEVDDGYYPKFSVQALMRGDAQSRANFYSRGILDGWMTRNDARRLEDMDPLPGLDEPLRPLNMGPGSTPPGDPVVNPPATPPVEDDA